MYVYHVESTLAQVLTELVQRILMQLRPNQVKLCDVVQILSEQADGNVAVFVHLDEFQVFRDIKHVNFQDNPRGHFKAIM